MLITFEGPEGAGKTTQIEQLRIGLIEAGHAVVTTREPGGTQVGEAIRSILLSYRSLVPRAEALLFNAARAQLVDQVIRPALMSGRTVLCDRYFDSTYAYQGCGRKQPLYPLRQLTAYAVQGCLPDLTFYLDIDPAAGLARKKGEVLNRLDQEALDFHERVREGFLALSKLEEWRWSVIDASQSADAVAGEILAETLAWFKAIK